MICQLKYKAITALYFYNKYARQDIVLTPKHKSPTSTFRGRNRAWAVIILQNISMSTINYLFVEIFEDVNTLYILLRQTDIPTFRNLA